MVKGLDIFRERFRAFEGAFMLIGGAACAEWFTTQGLQFRATKDLDTVLMIEVLDPKFVAALRAFVTEGGYELRERSDGTPMLYRFAKPVNGEFPYMLELFSRSPDGLKLADGQDVIPVRIEPDHHSLSAILLDDDYYGLIQTGHDLTAEERIKLPQPAHKALHRLVTAGELQLGDQVLINPLRRQAHLQGLLNLPRHGLTMTLATERGAGGRNGGLCGLVQPDVPPDRLAVHVQLPRNAVLAPAPLNQSDNGLLVRHAEVV